MPCGRGQKRPGRLNGGQTAAHGTAAARLVQVAAVQA